VSPGFILHFCRDRPVEADAVLPAWSSLPTELEYTSVTYMLYSIMKVISVFELVSFRESIPGLLLRNALLRYTAACYAIQFPYVVSWKLLLRSQGLKKSDLCFCPSLFAVG
jgi:hypothetical protein